MWNFPLHYFNNGIKLNIAYQRRIVLLEHWDRGFKSLVSCTAYSTLKMEAMFL
jgi:hypothetical protein